MEYIRLTESGYSPSESFKHLGLDPDIVGNKRIEDYDKQLKMLLKKLKVKEREAELLKQEKNF